MTDCSEIRNLLSEYLDHALDAKARARADEHLRTCPVCREELDSLRSLVKGIASIQSVRAPADFLSQVHKRMERPSKLSKMRQWLFYPLRVKIPLQLAGAAVTALIIFSILPLQQSSLKLPAEQEPGKKDTANYADEVKGRVKPEDSLEALVKKGQGPGPARERREAALKLKGQARAKGANTERDAAQAPTSPAVQEVQRQKLAAKAPFQEGKKEEDLQNDSESILSVRKAIEAATGRVLSVDYNPQTGRPESVSAEIPAGKTPLLYEKLKELGELEVAPETRPEKDSDIVQIRIRVTVSP